MVSGHIWQQLCDCQYRYMFMIFMYYILQLSIQHHNMWQVCNLDIALLGQLLEQVLTLSGGPRPVAVARRYEVEIVSDSLMPPEEKYPLIHL